MALMIACYHLQEDCSHSPAVTSFQVPYQFHYLQPDYLTIPVRTFANIPSFQNAATSVYHLKHFSIFT